MVHIPDVGRSISITMYGVGMEIVFGIFAGYLFIRYFNKTPSTEIFFINLFLFSVLFEEVRAGTVLILHYGLPLYYGIWVTKIAYFGYFFGVFCLFTASLFQVGIQYQKLGTIVGIISLLSFAFSYVLPVDISKLNSNLLFQIGNKNVLLLVIISIKVFTVMNYFWEAYSSEDVERVLLGVLIALILIGRNFLFHATDLFSIFIGFCCFVLGTLIFGRKYYMRSLWS